MTDWTCGEELAVTTEEPPLPEEQEITDAILTIAEYMKDVVPSIVASIVSALNEFDRAIHALTTTGPVYRCSGRWVAWRDGRWVPVVRFGKVWMWSA